MVFQCSHDNTLTSYLKKISMVLKNSKFLDFQCSRGYLQRTVFASDTSFLIVVFKIPQASREFLGVCQGSYYSLGFFQVSSGCSLESKFSCGSQKSFYCALVFLMVPQGSLEFPRFCNIISVSLRFLRFFKIL